MQVSQSKATKMAKSK